MDEDAAAAFAARLAPIVIERFRQAGREPRSVSDGEARHVRALTAAWLAPPQDTSLALGPPVSRDPPSQGLAALERTVWRLNANMDVYENPDLLDRALTQIPLQALYDEASSLSSSTTLGFEDALVDCLVRWYKFSYMRWVDALACIRCGGPAVCTKMDMPTPSEREGGADRVEIHTCTDAMCGRARRFARYNDPAILMKTREGRCGEWANLFTLFLRAVGLRTRYIWNAEDHVWNEYYSPSSARWVHVDSCEAARDKPLLYERGWGKKMSYIFGISIEGTRDVSRAYTADWPAMLGRRSWVREDEVEMVLRAVTKLRRSRLPAPDDVRLHAEDVTETARLARGPSEKGEEEPARESGSKEWTEARGEAGPSDR